MSAASQSPAPFDTHNAGTAAPQGFDEGDASESDIPKRMMRVKVLYTFDDDNKTNCLARLPNALPIPVVALDETTQIGVTELKICIQAIVASSPELIAKLEHDYTVYAYDYSEYETPLVGQGMLSWVLASASPTPSAPASQSQTMITGRVCKNILGLFSSNGIKETLEVKLKLVPVPTRSKNEFLQNMAAYRNPSVVMPDGFDNNAWNSFLQAIPNTSVIEETQMSQGQSNNGGRGQLTRSGTGGVEQLHDMLTPKFVQDDDIYSIGHHSSRAGSPAVSHHSFSAQQPTFDGSRPNSRLGMHGQQQQNSYAIEDQNFEDGPAPKRARLQQADWNGRGSFGTTADSLRVAVSTSASLRGFRPGSVAGNSSAGNDMVPRAATPRAGEKRGGRPLMPNRMSNLRRESSASFTNPSQMDQSMMRTDSGIFSHDEDAGSSHFSSPSPNLPSSPPEYTPIEDSFPPSSPGLPELPFPTDSGFQSDFFTDLPSEQPRPRGPRFADINQHVPPLNKHQMRQRDGVIEFKHVQPGLRKDPPIVSYAHCDKASQRAARGSASGKWADPNLPSSPTQQPAHRRGGRAKAQKNANTAPPSRQQSTTPFQLDAPSPNNPMQSIEMQSENNSPLDSSNGANGMQPPAIPTSAPAQAKAQPQVSEESQQGPIASTIRLPPRDPHSKQGQWPRPAQRGIKRSLSRTQSWTVGGGSSDIESDGATGDNGPKSSRPRNGSGVVRMKAIDTQLQNAVFNGAPVKYCRNCGEIKTSTWRPYWVRTYDGNGSQFQINAQVGIHYVESLATDDKGRTTKFRIYKQYSHLTLEDKTAGVYEQLIFCNPCGDWIRKWGELRPQERWDPAMKPIKKQRRLRKPKQPGQFTSDAIAPSSDWDIPPSTAMKMQRFSEMPNFTDPFLPSEGPMPPQSMAPTPHAQRPASGATQAPQQPPKHQREQKVSTSAADAWDADELEIALGKAIASSPARLMGSQMSPIEIAEETPNPTRRLLFPSPRKDGEFKSLADPPEDEDRSVTPTRSQRHKQKQVMKTTTKPSTPPLETEEVDKENLPPADEEDDDFAHLFDDTLLSGTPAPVTPRTEKTIARMFKTPTPVKPRTPRTGNGSKRSRTSHLLETPTRSSSGGIRKSPRFSGRGESGATTVSLMEQQQLTPISTSLNQLLSEAIRSSPGKNFGWSPGKLFGGDLGNINFHEGFPMSSSPPIFSSNIHGSSGIEVGFGGEGGAGADFGGILDLPGFEMWEDGTATDPVKGWEDFLASDAVNGDAFGPNLGETTIVEGEEKKRLGVEAGVTSVAEAVGVAEKVNEVVVTEVEKVAA